MMGPIGLATYGTQVSSVRTIVNVAFFSRRERTWQMKYFLAERLEQYTIARGEA